MSPPTLTSTYGSGSIISVCTSDTVTFTASGDVGPTANDAEFKIILAGASIYPVGGAPGPQATLSFSSYSLQNGDHVVATVYTYDYGLTFVYKVQLTNDIYFLPAIKLGYASSSVAIDNLIFEDQINAVTGFINTETIDPLAPQISSINYIDLGTSFIVHNEVFIAGLSLRNLNQPNASFNKESAEKLPISISVQRGYEFDLNSYRQGLLPEFSFLYLYEAVTKLGNSIQVSLSQEAQSGSFSLGSQQAWKLNTFSLTSIGLSVGASVENFDFGLQYNIPIKQINQVFAPSIFELYVAFDFSIYRRNNRGRYKRLVTDNY